MKDNKTDYLKLPLPDAGNPLNVDVHRLVAALELLDGNARADGERIQAESDQRAAALEALERALSIALTTAIERVSAEAREYTALEIDGQTAAFLTGLALKADAATVESALALKANLVSPTLTGNPTAPTQPAGNSSTRLANTAFVTAALADYLGGLKPGMFMLFLHRKTELPAGWHYPSGEYVAQSSAIGKALLSLPANLKSDWGIATSGSNIRLCDNGKFFSGVYGRFPRMASGNSVAYHPGVVESDAIRNITGSYNTHATVTSTGQIIAVGALAGSGTGTGGRVGGVVATDSGASFVRLDASGSVPTAAENRPYSVFLTPAIYLGV